MLGRNSWILACVLTLAGCAIPPYRTDVADAIDLCGSVGKLLAANTYYMGDVKSLFIDSKTAIFNKYPELTPDLRASAIRSVSHCINLQLKKITPEQYDHLMARETTGAAAVENALTREQLEALIAKGYRTVADILRDARVSDAAIAKIIAVTIADMSPSQEPIYPEVSPEMLALTDISTKVSELETALENMPAKVVKAINLAPRPSTEPLIKIRFSPGAATLNSEALLALHKSLLNIDPDAQLSVVGSADANGDKLRNMELSRLRAQSVAVWLIVNRQIEPQRIHIGALGAGKAAAISSNDRSATVFKY